MARYTGPKTRINRRLGAQIYESSGALRAMERRDTPPGMHTRPRRTSNYGLALREKQKIKHYYGMGERQLRRYFDKASHMKGNTGEQLLVLCERRLDNVFWKAGFAPTPVQSSVAGRSSRRAPGAFSSATGSRRSTRRRTPMAGVEPLSDFDEFNKRMVCGSPTIEPRVEPVPIRMPFPKAPYQGSIYENQRTLSHNYFEHLPQARRAEAT